MQEIGKAVTEHRVAGECSLKARAEVARLEACEGGTDAQIELLPNIHRIVHMFVKLAEASQRAEHGPVVKGTGWDRK